MHQMHEDAINDAGDLALEDARDAKVVENEDEMHEMSMVQTRCTKC